MKTNDVTTQMIEEMEQETLRMMKTLKKLKGKVENDDLTGLLRRDEFFHRLDQMIQQGQGANISIIMIDIDNFKKINDQDGHVAGDHVLQRVAKVLQRCKKIGAQVGRFGGEEFVIAFGGTQLQAKNLAEALRRQTEREVSVTISIGVATALGSGWEVRKMVGMADRALYQAKHAGKNRVCLAA